MAFNNRLAIIAGGLGKYPIPNTRHVTLTLATGGLGTATGKLLRARGAQLALLYAPFESSRREQIVEETYGKDVSDITTYECDITSPASVNSTFESLSSKSKNQSGPFPSILVNAAGTVYTGPLEDAPPEETVAQLHTNILGPMLISQSFARLYFRLSESQSHIGSRTPKPPPGRIVSISSQAAHVALPGHGAYCASKAGLLGLTRCMANEWGPRGITANTVSPTVALTTLGKRAWADEEKRSAMLAQIPTGRFAVPEEIAQAIVFLCRDDSGMINGDDVRIDGGFTIR